MLIFLLQIIIINFFTINVQSRIIWNSSNSSIVGFSMSSDNFNSLHDVYETLKEDERCQKTAYIVQFLWRDLSSNFDVIGPYYNCSSSMEAHSLHSMVIQTMLAFCQISVPYFVMVLVATSVC